MDNKYEIKIIDSITELERMSEPWNNLLRQSGSNTIFLTWEWLYTWAECYLSKKRRLFILAVYRDDELIGIAPWYINTLLYGPFKLRQIEFLGIPETSSDYIDVICKKGKERDIARLIFTHLYKQTSSVWDVLMLRNIPSESVFLANFIDCMKREGKYFETQAGAFCPYLNLPSKKEDFIFDLSPNRRRRFNYDLNVLKRDGEILYRRFYPVNNNTILDNFFALYQMRWGNDNMQFYTFLEKLIKRCNEKERVRIDFLNVNGKEVASLFFLIYENVINMYLMAIDTNFNKKISVGNIMTKISIEHAIEDKYSFYDFLKGNEEYKFYWTKEGKRCLNLFSCQRRLGTLVLTTNNMFKKFCKILLR